MIYQKEKGSLLLSITIFILVVLTTLIEVRITLAESKQDYSQAFLNTLSQELGVSATSLEIVKEATLSLLYLNQQFPTAKVRNRETDMVYEVTLDVSGRRVKKDDLLAQELAIKRAKYGKLEPELHNRLQTLRQNETVDVAVWITAPDDPMPRPTPEEFRAKGEALIEAELKVHAEQKKARLKVIQEPLQRRLQIMSAEILDVNGLAPIISAKLNKGQIHAIANLPDVEGIYLVHENQPLLSVSAPTVAAPTVWARGITGSGYKVAIIEGGGISFNNPNLSGSNYHANDCIEVYNYHATKVAGVAASTDGLYRGIAYGVTLLGGGAGGGGMPCDDNYSYSDYALQAATTWAYNNGSRIHNNSWSDNSAGRPTNMSRFNDTVVRDWHATVVAASGNCNVNCYVAAPALAYNVISVGAFDERNTLWWSDDIIWGYPNFPLGYSSSYIDPISGHGDREKPEVVAPGADIITTSGVWEQNGCWGCGWFITDSGTSLAAPHVSGGAALLLERNSSFLQYWPEIIKAILMATAKHNIEGSSRLSEYDGAGGISLDYADQVASNPYTNFWMGTLYPNYYGIDHYFYAAANQKVRAVITWDATPSYAGYDYQPGVDLDLYVYKPSGGTIAGSGSWDNTYEIVEFIAPETGYYRLLAYKYRFNDSLTYLGMAWFNE